MYAIPLEVSVSSLPIVKKYVIKNGIHNSEYINIIEIVADKEQNKYEIVYWEEKAIPMTHENSKITQTLLSMIIRG